MDDDQSGEREDGFEDKTEWTRAALSYRARWSNSAICCSKM